MPNCFAIISASLSLFCFAKQQHAGFLTLQCKPSNSHFWWQNTFQFRAMKNIHIFYVWFDFHGSWCSFRKQWMICFQEMAALGHEAMFVSGKHSYGAVVMYQPAKVLCAQATKVLVSVSQKESPGCCNKCWYLIKIKLPFLAFSFKYLLFSFVELGFGLEVFLQRSLFFLQFNLTLPFIALQCREETFFIQMCIFYFAESSSWLFFSCDCDINFFSCVSLSKKDKDFDG